jgi:hypothetical protein
MTQATGRVELTDDRAFSQRIQRLVVISADALGEIWGLAYLQEAPAWTQMLIGLGWVLMPVLLARSLRRPTLRYLLVLPASCVSLGLIGIVLSGPDATRAGWILITLGVLTGGTLGMWFWYRWAPVPAGLENPFGSSRIALIAVHASLVLVGVGLVWVNL